MEQLGSGGELIAGLRQFLLDAVTIEHQPVEPRADTGLGQAAICCEVDEPLFLHPDLVQLLLQSVVEVLRRLLLFGHSHLQHVLNFVDEVFRQLQRRVVRFDRPLDLQHRQIRHVARALLATAAEKIAVQVAVAAPSLGVDQTPLPTRQMATLTEQHALEVMHQDAVALASSAAHLQHVLHLIEQSLRNDRRVSPWQQLAVVHDEADVVRVFQHGVQLAGADGAFTPLGCWPSGQAEVRHLVGQPFHG